MSQEKHKTNDKKPQELGDETNIGDKLPFRDVSRKEDVEQTRIENRREADLEDKTPGGDGGPEDILDQRQAHDPMEDSNY